MGPRPNPPSQTLRCQTFRAERRYEPRLRGLGAAPDPSARASARRALTLLSAGVGLVQYSEMAAAGTAAAAAASAVSGGALLGIGAVLLSSLLSGFANVYFEKVVKQSDVTLWMRNIQLGLFAVPQSACLLLSDQAVLAAHGPLVGFSPLVWAVVFLKGGGGLLVAAVVKFADNVLKTYATAIAIVLTCVITSISASTMPSLGFLQGMAMVITSMLLYNLKPAEKPPTVTSWYDSGKRL